MKGKHLFYSMGKRGCGERNFREQTRCSFAVMLEMSTEYLRGEHERAFLMKVRLGIKDLGLSPFALLTQFENLHSQNKTKPKTQM